MTEILPPIFEYISLFNLLLVVLVLYLLIKFIRDISGKKEPQRKGRSNKTTEAQLRARIAALEREKAEGFKKASRRKQIARGKAQQFDITDPANQLRFLQG